MLVGDVAAVDDEVGLLRSENLERFADEDAGLGGLADVGVGHDPDAQDRFFGTDKTSGADEPGGKHDSLHDGTLTRSKGYCMSRFCNIAHVYSIANFYEYHNASL